MSRVIGSWERFDEWRNIDKLITESDCLHDSEWAYEKKPLPLGDTMTASKEY